MAHVSAICLLPVWDKSAIFIDFRAIGHSISAREGGNSFLESYGSKENRRRQWDVLVPSETPYGETTRARIRRFWSDATKNGLVGSASPFGSFDAFARKHNPNVGSALRASPFDHCKCTRHQFFVLLMSASRSRTCCARLRPLRVWPWQIFWWPIQLIVLTFTTYRHWWRKHSCGQWQYRT